ncbi:unnamed protein product [Camellia sinensis]
MADPTPLILSRTESETPSGIRRVEGDEKYIPPSSSSSTLDETIEQCLGDFGWAQFFQAALVSVAWVFDAQQTFVSVFTDAQPTWHLTTTTGGGDTMMMICQLPRNSWAWDMPIDTSIISEWSLECAGSIMTGLPASSFFMGCLTGGFILATLADSSSLGRKNMLLLSCLLMSLAGLSTVFFSTNIWIYSALSFVSGFGRSTIGTCALVLSTELVGKRWRPQVGIIGFICFTLGFLSLPAIAYFNRGSSWRLLYLWTCVPAIFYCVLFHFLALESPRWLFLRGRKQEFLATLKTLATPAKRSSMTTSIDDDDDDDIEQVQVVEEESCKDKDKAKDKDDVVVVVGGVYLYSAMKMLLEKSWALKRLLAVMVIGFGIGMVYYGMPLGVGSLALNLYLSTTFNALSELPASLVTFLLVGRLNRKGSLLGFTTLSGMCSVMCSFLVVVMRSSDDDYNNNNNGQGQGDKMMTSSWCWWWKGFQIGLEMISFFSACTAFNVLLIYTIELFPTCVRNSAMSMVRQALVLGGVFSPVLVAAGRNNSGLLSYGVFGVTIGLCGLFVTFLPETRGHTICDTMDEEEPQT